MNPKEIHTETHYNQIVKRQRQRENLIAVREEQLVKYKGASIILSADLSEEISQTRM